MLGIKVLRTLLLIFFIICISQVVKAQDPMETLFLSMNWKVGSEQEDNFIGKVSSAQIIDLFIEIEKRDEKAKCEQLGSSWEDLKEIQGSKTVAGHEVKDLNNNGQYEVIVPVGISAVTNYLSIISKVGETIKVKHFEKSYHFEDVNNDGKEELLIHTILAYKTWTINEGTVIWFDIYEWDGSEFKIVNDKFPDFYQKMITEYNARMEKLRNEFDPYQKAQETDQSIEYWQEQRDKEIKACEEGVRKAGLVFAIPATIDLNPETLNLKSKGKWITCYIELQSDFNVSNINVSTILLNNTLSCEMSPTNIGDYDNDGLRDLMVKFDRDKLISLLTHGEITLTVTGKMMSGEEFSGNAVIKVISNGSSDSKEKKEKKNK